MEDFKILVEKENPLFNRKEIKILIYSEVTPSQEQIRKIISEKFSAPEENIRIKNILGSFGSKNFTISANIYTSEKDKLDTEGPSKKDKKSEDKPESSEKKPEAQPMEEKEKPAEQTQEQNKEKEEK